MKNLTCEINKNKIIKTVNIGDFKALCIDNFLMQPNTIESYARESSFTPYPGYEEGKGYPGVRASAPENYSCNLTKFLEPLIKNTFNVGKNKDIRKSMCAMSLLTTPESLLTPLQSTPHFDSSEPEHIAAVFYLCSPQQGGTAFYKHKATGLQRLTKQNVDKYLDAYYDELNTRLPKPTYCLNNSDFFEKVGSIDAVYNRLVVYPGSILHNPFVPNPNLSISTKPDNGRLTINTFFNF
ncbi:MAG: DUF6445 family protein [Paraglaciecola sp.]|uniref:DUF6445 family protein n=3 Tax=Paraglaciecola sp. TaxID=1920173 RepID=UPI003264402C